MADQPITRLTLFVPGPKSVSKSFDAEWIENPRDGSFAQSFGFGTVDRTLQATIDAADGAVLIQLTDDLLEGRQKVVKAVERLQKQGALAVRFEQSKLGWAPDHLLEMLNGDAWGLHRCAVTMLSDGNRVTSCGMHAFSLPDASVELDEHLDADAAREFINALNVYQLDEDPVLLSGQTFRPHEQTPRRRLQRWPDDGYPPSHWCHNPFGVWRLGEANGKGDGATELAFQFMPSLVTLLTALESEKGPLTKKQVEAARDGATCMTVDHRLAQRAERSRGYADLDPELVWEQWRVVSANRD